MEAATPVALPGGAAYRVTSSTPGVVEYVFYRDGVGAILQLVNLDDGLTYDVAATFTLN